MTGIAERLETSYNYTTMSPLSTIETDILMDSEDDSSMPEKMMKRSLFLKKLLYKKYVNDVMKDVNLNKQFT